MSPYDYFVFLRAIHSVVLYYGFMTGRILLAMLHSVINYECFHSIAGFGNCGTAESHSLPAREDHERVDRVVSLPLCCRQVFPPQHSEERTKGIEQFTQECAEQGWAVRTFLLTNDNEAY